MAYVSDFTRRLQEEADPDLTARKYGWTPDEGFVIGNDKYTADGDVVDVRVNRKVSTDIRKALESKGKLDAWVRGTEILNKPQYHVHQFAVLAAFASPVLHISGVSGAVLSLAGQSGSGKTTAVRFGLSAWGDPDVLMAPPDSTVVARDTKMKFLCNIPHGIDDLSGDHLKSPHLKNVVYQAVNGRAKERGNQYGGLQEQATWNLIMFITTNNPLIEQTKFLVEAERRRMLELNVNESMGVADGEALNDICVGHHGVVGRELIKLMIKHRETVNKRARELSKKWLSAPDIPDANRFGVWMCAASLVIGKLAYAHGLIKFDPVPPVRHALDELRNVSKIILTPAETMEDEVSAFINTNINSISYSRAGKWAELGTHHQKIVARMDYDRQMIYIPAGQLRAWLATQNVSTSVLHEWVREAGIERNKNTLMAMKGSRQKCYCIPWDIPDNAVTDIQGD